MLKHNLIFQNTSGNTILTLPVRPEGIDPVIIAPLLSTLSKHPANKAVFQNIASKPARPAPGIHANTTGTPFIDDQGDQEEQIPVIGSYNALTGGFE
jgi:hypothetical protein